MMEQTNQSFLATEHVGGLMRKYAVPCIISLLVGALYNIVDQIFIANADYLGSYGNAANTVVFPLTVIALAIAVMIGDGCCAFVSLSLGRQKAEDANHSVGNAIVLTLVSGIVLCIIYLVFQEPIITMFGGTVNAETFRHSKEYFFYDIPWDSVLYVRTVDESCDPGGRKSQVCHGLHPRGRCHQHDSGPCLYLPF